jgi:hypothetical protein
MAVEGWIVEGIGIAVGADAGDSRVPCVRLDEPAKLRVIVAGMETSEIMLPLL